MTKVGRNDPCPCGSGQKYKRCCLPKDEAAAQEQSSRATAQAAQAAAELKEKKKQKEKAAKEAWEQGRELADLTEASNAVIDMVHAGKLDEAETAARDLLVRFPDVHDGYDRLGMVYEARGQKGEAADCYRKVIEFVTAHPEQYDPEFADTFHRLVAKLDPDTGSASAS